MGLISVIGSGRSGTHWLGRVLGSDPRVRLYLENSRAWPCIVAAATEGRAECVPTIVSEYQEMQRSNKVVVDKSHPALWLVEELAEEVKGIRFVGIQRDVMGVVASTFKHRGTRRWAERWKRLPYPNSFLGYVAPNKQWYEETDLIGRIVARWCSHKLELERLGARDDVLVVSYEDMAHNPESARGTLRKFTGLDIGPIEPRTKSLSKWETQLTETEQARVREAVQECMAYFGGDSGE